MNTITVKSPLVELDGDEMTRVMWSMIKEKLIFPFLNIDLEYYDLHVKHRDNTDDAVTFAAAEAIKKHKVGVKCATITATPDRVAEYDLKTLSKSPNATIRAMLDGTVFRAPILVKSIQPNVRTWTKPIVIGRHAYGDVYRNAEISVPGAGLAELVFTPADGGEPQRVPIHQFKAPGVIQGMHNTDASIRSFARASFTYALGQKIDVWFATKDTISKTYDGRFREIFQEVFDAEFKTPFAAAGIEYFYTLIDDVVARVMKAEGGFLWCCKNYDGDVMSDMVASAFGSLALMTSILVSPDGCFEYEAAHGTVQRHYYKHLKGEETSSNSMALIFAWTGALRKRGELDNTPEVCAFADALEAVSIETIESGIMTGDLARIAQPRPVGHVNTEGFIAAVAERLAARLSV